MAKVVRETKATFALTIEQNATLDFVADGLGVSKSTLIRDAITAYLAPIRAAMGMGEGHSGLTAMAHDVLLDAKSPEDMDRGIERLLVMWGPGSGREDLLQPRDEQVVRMMLACAKASLEQGYDKPLYALVPEIVGAGR